MKPSDEVIPVKVGWTVEKFVEEVKEVKKRPSTNGQGVNGKKPVQVKASSNGKVAKKAPPKKSAAKAKPAKKSTAKKKR